MGRSVQPIGDAVTVTRRHSNIRSGDASRIPRRSGNVQGGAVRTRAQEHSGGLAVWRSGGTRAAGGSCGTARNRFSGLLGRFRPLPCPEV
jgi:hypothetical protein